MLLIGHRSYFRNRVIVSVVRFVDECYGQTMQKWGVEADPVNDRLTISQNLQAF